MRVLSLILDKESHYMKSHRLRIITALIVANLTFGAYVLYQQNTLRATFDSSSAAPDSVLPIVELRDDRGRSFSTGQFLGTNLFVQFVNPQVDAQIDSVIDVLTNPPSRPVSWLLFTNDAPELRRRLSAVQSDAVIVDDGYLGLRRIFNVPQCCETRSLFDEKGDLKYRGYYFDSDGVVVRLRNLVDGKQAYSPALMLDALNSLPEGYFVRVRNKTLRSHSGKAVVAVFSSVNATCPSGITIGRLNDYARRYGGVEFLALLPNTHSELDVKNLKANLDIPFSVERADEALSGKLMSLVEKYGEKTVNGAVVVIERGAISLVEGDNEIGSRLAGEGA